MGMDIMKPEPVVIEEEIGIVEAEAEAEAEEQVVIGEAS
jgi:hypothetical protein